VRANAEHLAERGRADVEHLAERGFKLTKQLLIK